MEIKTPDDQNLSLATFDILVQAEINHCEYLHPTHFYIFSWTTKGTRVIKQLLACNSILDNVAISN